MIATRRSLSIALTAASLVLAGQAAQATSGDARQKPATPSEQTAASTTDAYGLPVCPVGPAAATTAGVNTLEDVFSFQGSTSALLPVPAAKKPAKEKTAAPAPVEWREVAPADKP